MVVHMRLKRPAHVGLVLGGLLGPFLGAVEPQGRPFSQDVTEAIDDGLRWFRRSTIYSDPEFAPHAKGLALRALLETRGSVSVGAPSRGYAAAASSDQELAESTVQAILNDVTFGVARGGCEGANGFDAYTDGQNMLALSLYASTGGPGVENRCHFTPRSAIDRLVTRTLDNQSRTRDFSGFWGTAGTEGLSWPTLFAASGLAAAKEYYLKLDVPPGTDSAAATRATAIDDALVRTARGYAGVQNGDGGEGHRVYRDLSSYQQTAAGIVGRFVGGKGA